MNCVNFLLCTPPALAITVNDLKGSKKKFRFSMKQLRGFRNLEQALNACDIRISEDMRFTHSNGMQVFKHSPFQICDVVVKVEGRIKFQIIMQSLY